MRLVRTIAIRRRAFSEIAYRSFTRFGAAPIRNGDLASRRAAELILQLAEANCFPASWMFIPESVRQKLRVTARKFFAHGRDVSDKEVKLARRARIRAVRIDQIAARKVALAAWECTQHPGRGSRTRNRILSKKSRVFTASTNFAAFACRPQGLRAFRTTKRKRVCASGSSDLVRES